MCHRDLVSKVGDVLAVPRVIDRLDERTQGALGRVPVPRMIDVLRVQEDSVVRLSSHSEIASPYTVNHLQ